MTVFAIALRAGSAWREGVPLEEQGLAQHRDYLRALAAAGAVLAAGPFTSSDGGFLVSAATFADAERIFQEDPAVRDSIFAGEVHVWKPLIDPGGRFAARP